jgi:HK97 family phage prohead protease
VNMREMLIRSAVPEDVRPDKREIDVLAVPYDVETQIYEQDGSKYRESIAPGAFANVAARADRVRVFRDHRPDRVVGKCRTIDGDRTDGLHATLIIGRTELGNETLALAAEGMLDVSIGFSPRTDQWSPGRTAVRRTSCWLHELSMVPLPAYETANVLAVREQIIEASTPSPPKTATPYLDELRDWQTKMRYGAD